VLGFLAAVSLSDTRVSVRECTRMFRLVAFIGRWSMLDVFVVTLTVALVRFKSLAVITAGPGAIAFGSVVILTMMASMQFDPRLIWDHVDGSTQKPQDLEHD
jgi:paraquat-inducible protein A